MTAADLLPGACPGNPFVGKDLLKAYATLTQTMAPSDTATIMMRSNLGLGSLFHLDGCRTMNRSLTEMSSVRLRAVPHLTPAVCCRSDLAAVNAALMAATLQSTTAPAVRARWLLQLWLHLQRSQRFTADVLSGAAWVLPSIIDTNALDREAADAVRALSSLPAPPPLPVRDGMPVDVVAVTALSAVGLLSDLQLAATLRAVRVELSPEGVASAMSVLAQRYRVAELQSEVLYMIAIIPAGTSPRMRSRLFAAVGESSVGVVAESLSPHHAKLTVDLAASGSFADRTTVADVASALA